MSKQVLYYCNKYKEKKYVNSQTKQNHIALFDISILSTNIKILASKYEESLPEILSLSSKNSNSEDNSFEDNNSKNNNSKNSDFENCNSKNSNSEENDYKKNNFEENDSEKNNSKSNKIKN